MISDSDSSLSPFPCCFFLVTSFGVLFSASCWSPSFPLERLDGLDCWSSHWWCDIDCRKSRRRLIRVVLMERANELSKMLDR